MMSENTFSALGVLSDVLKAIFTGLVFVYYIIFMADALPSIFHYCYVAILVVLTCALLAIGPYVTNTSAREKVAQHKKNKLKLLQHTRRSVSKRTQAYITLRDELIQSGIPCIIDGTPHVGAALMHDQPRDRIAERYIRPRASVQVLNALNRSARFNPTEVRKLKHLTKYFKDPGCCTTDQVHAFREALHDLREELGIAENETFKEAIRGEALNIKEYGHLPAPLAKAAGFPFPSKKKRDVVEAGRREYDKMLAQNEEVIDKLKNRPIDDETFQEIRDDAYEHHMYTTGRSRFGSVDSVLGAARMVMFLAYAPFFLSYKYAYHFNVVFRDKCCQIPSAIGLSQFHGEPVRLFIYFAKLMGLSLWALAKKVVIAGFSMMSLDVSSWDASVRKELLIEMLDWHCDNMRLAIRNEDDRQHIERFILHYRIVTFGVIYASVVMGADLWQLDHGVKSGTPLTATDNTIIHMCVVRAWFKLEGRDPPPFIVYGDDNFIAVPHGSDMHNIDYWVRKYEEFGFLIKKEEGVQYFHDTFDGPDFLSKHWELVADDEVPFRTSRPAEDNVTHWAKPDEFIPSAERNRKQMTTVRGIGQLIDGVWNMETRTLFSSALSAIVVDAEWEGVEIKPEYCNSDYQHKLMEEIGWGKFKVEELANKAIDLYRPPGDLLHAIERERGAITEKEERELLSHSYFSRFGNPKGSAAPLAALKQTPGYVPSNGTIQAEVSSEIITSLDTRHRSEGVKPEGKEEHKKKKRRENKGRKAPYVVLEVEQSPTDPVGRELITVSELLLRTKGVDVHASRKPKTMQALGVKPMDISAHLFADLPRSIPKASECQPSADNEYYRYVASIVDSTADWRHHQVSEELNQYSKRALAPFHSCRVLSGTAGGKEMSCIKQALEWHKPPRECRYCIIGGHPGAQVVSVFCAFPKVKLDLISKIPVGDDPFFKCRPYLNHCERVVAEPFKEDMIIGNRYNFVGIDVFQVDEPGEASKITKEGVRGSSFLMKTLQPIVEAVHTRSVVYWFKCVGFTIEVGDWLYSIRSRSKRMELIKPRTSYLTNFEYYVVVQPGNCLPVGRSAFMAMFYGFGNTMSVAVEKYNRARQYLLTHPGCVRRNPDQYDAENIALVNEEILPTGSMVLSYGSEKKENMKTDILSKPDVHLNAMRASEMKAGVIRFYSNNADLAHKLSINHDVLTSLDYDGVVQESRSHAGIYISEARVGACYIETKADIVKTEDHLCIYAPFEIEGCYHTHSATLVANYRKNVCGIDTNVAEVLRSKRRKASKDRARKVDFVFKNDRITYDVGPGDEIWGRAIAGDTEYHPVLRAQDLEISQDCNIILRHSLHHMRCEHRRKFLQHLKDASRTFSVSVYLREHDPDLKQATGIDLLHIQYDGPYGWSTWMLEPKSPIFDKSAIHAVYTRIIEDVGKQGLPFT